MRYHDRQQQQRTEKKQRRQEIASLYPRKLTAEELMDNFSVQPLVIAPRVQAIKSGFSQQGPNSFSVKSKDAFTAARKVYFTNKEAKFFVVTNLSDDTHPQQVFDVADLVPAHLRHAKWIARLNRQHRQVPCNTISKESVQNELRKDQIAEEADRLDNDADDVANTENVNSNINKKASPSMKKNAKANKPTARCQRKTILTHWSH